MIEIRDRKNRRVLLRVEAETLERAKLVKAWLRRANLHGANLARADLRRAYLRGADLGGANLRRANLQGADLRGALYDDRTRWPWFFNPNRRGCFSRPVSFEILPADSPGGRGDELAAGDE
jgi:uncharacterized protein YjbI with pentapeptide repeats